MSQPQQMETQQQAQTNTHNHHHQQQQQQYRTNHETSVGYNQSARARKQQTGGGGGGGGGAAGDTLAQQLQPSRRQESPPISRLSGLQCDSFTLIDAGGATSTAKVTSTGDSQQATQRRAGGNIGQSLVSLANLKDQQQQQEIAGRDQQQQLGKQSQSTSNTSPSSNRGSPIEQDNRFKLKTAALVGEPNNNSLVYSPFGQTPIGSLAAALKMDAASNNSNSQSPRSRDQLLTAAVAPQSASATQRPSNGLSPISKLLASPNSLQTGQQLATTNYPATTIFNQHQSLSKLTTISSSTTTTTSKPAPTSTALSHSSQTASAYRRPVWPSASLAADQEIARRQQQQQQQQQQQLLPLKKQAAVDLGEKGSILLSKRTTESSRLTSNHSPPFRGSKSRLVVAKDYDYMSNDDNDDAPGGNVNNYSQSDEEESDEDGGEEDEDEEDEDEEEEEDDDDDQEEGVESGDERVPFKSGANLANNIKQNSNNNKLIASSGKQSNGYITNNTKRHSSSASKLGSAAAADYPGSAHKQQKSNRNIKKQQQQQPEPLVKRLDRSKLNSSASSLRLKQSQNSSKRNSSSMDHHQHHQQARISMNDIHRPPSFNTCQLNQKQSNNCRKQLPDLFEHQAAWLNCNCKDCSKKRKSASLNQYQVAKLNGAAYPQLVESGAILAQSTKQIYPKTTIMHLVLKSLVLILCSLLLLILLTGIVMVSVHMPKAVEQLMNTPHSFNVTIATG